MLSCYYKNQDFGNFEIQCTEKGISRFRKVEECITSDDSSPILVETIKQLDAYFARKLQKFDLPIDWLEANDFSIKVWQALLEIPYGKTASYSDIAHQIGSPKGVRAVGMANRNNPIGIIVPCHRVIGKSGKLTGYFYGLDMKMQLLRLENPVRFAPQASLFSL